MNPVSVKMALDIVLQHTSSVPVRKVPLDRAAGRVLAAEQFADRDFPPYDRVAMDGIAIRLGELSNLPQRSYDIKGMQAAGDQQKRLMDAGHCFEIMTGAILPEGADTVVPYEQIDIRDGRAKLRVDKINRRNIHRKGQDLQKGDPVLPKGKVIGPGEIGVLATIGAAEVPVFDLPRVALVSTGDELVDVGASPAPHQIRKSNIHSLHAALAQEGIGADRYHLDDKADLVKDHLEKLIRKYDVLMLSGGVSKGKYDVIPQTLKELDIAKLFHRVAQKPGKPFWFGVHKQSATHVFAFPGNPVSTFVCYLFYFRKWLYHSLEAALEFEKRKLSEAVRVDNKRTQFVPVRIDRSTNQAMPLKYGGSGDMLVLAEAEGFLMVPEGVDTKVGERAFEYIAI